MDTYQYDEQNSKQRVQKQGKGEANSYEPWHTEFLKILPTIQRQASLAYRGLRGETRDDLIGEVIAYTVIAFKTLHDKNRVDLAYPTVLAAYGIRRANIGRKVGMQLNSHDLLSEYCRRKNDIIVERLDKFNNEMGERLETIVADPRPGPPENAAVRIDFCDWLGRLNARDREIAMSLATGHTTGEVAKHFGLSSGRISQKRQEYLDSWRIFQDENPASQ